MKDGKPNEELPCPAAHNGGNPKKKSCSSRPSICELGASWARSTEHKNVAGALHGGARKKCRPPSANQLSTKKKCSTNFPFLWYTHSSPATPQLRLTRSGSQPSSRRNYSCTKASNAALLVLYFPAGCFRLQSASPQHPRHSFTNLRGPAISFHLPTTLILSLLCHASSVPLLLR